MRSNLNTNKFLGNQYRFLGFLFIFTFPFNSVNAKSINPNLSKPKSTNLKCENRLIVNSFYYCWDGVRFIKIDEHEHKLENNKLVDSSSPNNIRLNQITDKLEDKKLVDSSPSNNIHPNEITDKLEDKKLVQSSPFNNINPNEITDKLENNKLIDSSLPNNIRLNEITDKLEDKKLVQSSPFNNIHPNEITDKLEGNKILINNGNLLSTKYKGNSNKVFITPIIKRVKDEKPKENEPNPGLSFGIPSAMGSSWKDVFVSIAYTADYDEGLFTWHNENNSKVADGSMNFGFGFGDPNESIGGEVSVGIISLFSQNGESGFGADGTAGIKFHKAIPSLFNTHAAIAWSNPIKWGEATKKDTVYGVLSKEFELRPDTNNKFSSLLTIGIGTGAHRSNTTIKDNRNDPNLFGGYGVQILPRLSVASSWNGNALNAGFGLSPFDFPLNFSIGISDLTNNSKKGSQFNINTGYSFTF